MTRALLVLLALCAGCNKDDLCGDTVPMDVVCFTVHVGGSVDPGDIAQLQVDAKYQELSGTSSSGTTIARRTLVGVDPRDSDMGTAGLPISFPLVFQLPAQPNFNSKVVVVALDSRGNKLGVGVGKLGVGSLGLDAPKPGTKNSVDVKLTQASNSDCFKPSIIGSAITDKTDIDCGGDSCPACIQNRRCSSSSDCVFPLTCNFSSDTCQP
jgi:hypothetical protein